jgi:hypothetical protein
MVVSGTVKRVSIMHCLRQVRPRRAFLRICISYSPAYRFNKPIGLVTGSFPSRVPEVSRWMLNTEAVVVYLRQDTLLQ